MSTKQWAAGLALLAASSVALAFSGEFYSADAGFVSGKTRSQVIRELEQAQADGSYQERRAEAIDPLAWNTQRATGAPQAIAVASRTQVFGTTAQAVALKDGTTVYVFDDGKMGMENAYGRAERMEPGHVMEAADGRRITMVGDEVARVNALHHAEYPGGR